MTDFKKGDFILVCHNAHTAWRLAIFHGWTHDHSMVEVELYDTDGSLHRYAQWKQLPAVLRPGGQFMVSADGGRAPTKIHDSFNAACTEAKRLIEERDAHRTRVLRLERTYACKRVAVEESNDGLRQTRTRS